MHYGGNNYQHNTPEELRRNTRNSDLHTVVKIVFIGIKMAPKEKELSEDLKKNVFNLHQNGLGYKLISRRMHISVNTVAKVIQQYKVSGQLSNEHRTGRPSILTVCDIHYIQRCVMDDKRRTASSLAQEVPSVCGKCVSPQTIRRSLNQFGVHGRIPRRKPPLTTKSFFFCR
ncbi:transposase [Octopus vulgaris]|uniref:Transposase n=1 Tax=Octopus vulgaris TaxID=6645 RepID=A0AA36AK94_OCTVU|nr:transposase [Octopus vulgaris]